jgi:hypothetical protein
MPEKTHDFSLYKEKEQFEVIVITLEWGFHALNSYQHLYMADRVQIN